MTPMEMVTCGGCGQRASLEKVVIGPDGNYRCEECRARALWGTHKPSRCCGRCDGHNDECVADMVCQEHNEQGCEACWPHPETPAGCICVHRYGENKACGYCYQK